jgi:hypothetical protein
LGMGSGRLLDMGIILYAAGNEVDFRLLSETIKLSVATRASLVLVGAWDCRVPPAILPLIPLIHRRGANCKLDSQASDTCH